MTFYTDLIERIDVIHRAGQTPFLWSGPGAGKTSLAQELSTRETTSDGTSIAGVVHVRIGAREPRDFLGIPIKSAVTVAGAQYPVTQDTVPRWALECWTLARDGDAIYVVMDEFTHARLETQLAVQDIVLSRTLPSGFELPDTVRFILMGNPPETVTGVSPLASSVAARVVHLPFEPPLEDWLEGLENRWGGPASAEIALFLRAHPNLVHVAPVGTSCGWPNRRSWTMLSHTYTPAHRDLALATVGEAVGQAFIDFCDAQRSIDVESLFTDEPIDCTLDTASRLPTLMAVALQGVSVPERRDRAVDILNAYGHTSEAVVAGRYLARATGVHGFSPALEEMVLESSEVSALLPKRTPPAAR